MSKKKKFYSQIQNIEKNEDLKNAKLINKLYQDKMNEKLF